MAIRRHDQRRHCLGPAGTRTHTASKYPRICYPPQLTNCTKAAVCDSRFEEQANSTVALVVRRETPDPESECRAGLERRRSWCCLALLLLLPLLPL